MLKKPSCGDVIRERNGIIPAAVGRDLWLQSRVRDRLTLSYQGAHREPLQITSMKDRVARTQQQN